MNAVSSVPPDGLVLCPRQYGALTGSHIGGVNDILLPFVSGSTSSTSSQSCAWAQNGNISLSILLAPWAGTKTSHFSLHWSHLNASTSVLCSWLLVF